MAATSGVEAAAVEHARSRLGIDRVWADLLTRAISPEPAAMVRDGGVIATGYDADLDELRGIDHTSGGFLIELETR